MQFGSWFVEYVQVLVVLVVLKFGCQFDMLCFVIGKFGGWLFQVQVVQFDIVQQLQWFCYSVFICEEFVGFVYGYLQYFGDVVFVLLYFQCGFVVVCVMVCWVWCVYVGYEQQFYVDEVFVFVGFVVFFGDVE